MKRTGIPDMAGAGTHGAGGEPADEEFVFAVHPAPLRNQGVPSMPTKNTHRKVLAVALGVVGLAGLSLASA
ncbi:MAG: hypothetical protein KJ548_09660, partial [Actinobacteria bacterium]|nr:hypothetical protein [Actinomycetota bacterium]